MRNTSILLSVALLSACSDVEDDHHGHDHHEHEMITTVMLTFESSAGDIVEASFYDPMDGSDPTTDGLTLVNGEAYTLAVSFWNELEDPAEDITEEIHDEAEEHQVFIYGDAVDSAASEADNPLIETSYVDTDEAGLVLGLEHDVTVLQAGTGTLSLLLRHMPTENGESIKTADLASDFVDGGSSALPGATDVDVDFTLVIE